MTNCFFCQSTSESWEQDCLMGWPAKIGVRSVIRRWIPFAGLLKCPLGDPRQAESVQSATEKPKPTQDVTRHSRQQHWRLSVGPDNDGTGHHKMAAMLARCPTTNVYRSAGYTTQDVTRHSRQQHWRLSVGPDNDGTG